MESVDSPGESSFSSDIDPEHHSTEACDKMTDQITPCAVDEIAQIIKQKNFYQMQSRRFKCERDKLMRTHVLCWKQLDLCRRYQVPTQSLFNVRAADF
jgi:hypothetical protein